MHVPRLTGTFVPRQTHLLELPLEVRIKYVRPALQNKPDDTFSSSRLLRQHRRNGAITISYAVRQGSTEDGGMTNHGQVYLQTFCAFIIKNINTRFVRGILDRRQRLFVTEDLAKKLQLQVLGETQIVLNTFGCASPKTVERRQTVEVPLCSQHSSDTCKMRAMIVPVICDDIASPKVDSLFLQSLRFESKVTADEKKFDAKTENSLSLLIGADHIWQIMSGRIIKSAEVPGLVAIDTAFGWMLQGPSHEKLFLTAALA